MTNVALSALLTSSPGLRRLSLYWNLNVGDEALLHVAALCTGLRALSLSGCKNVTDAGVRAVTRECHDLTALDLTRCRCTDSPQSHPRNPVVRGALLLHDYQAGGSLREPKRTLSPGTVAYAPCCGAAGSCNSLCRVSAAWLTHRQEHEECKNPLDGVCTVRAGASR